MRLSLLPVLLVALLSCLAIPAQAQNAAATSQTPAIEETPSPAEPAEGAVEGVTEPVEGPEGFDTPVDAPAETPAEAPAAEPTPEPAAAPVETPAATPVAQPAGAPVTLPPTGPATSIPPAEPGQEEITLSLTGPVQLRALLDWVQDVTGMYFMFEDATLATGSITLLPAGKIRRDHVLPLFESVLAYEQLVMVPSTGKWTIIKRAPDAGKSPIPLITPEQLMGMPDTDAVLTVVYPLKYSGVQDIQASVTQLAAGPGAGAIVALMRANVLLLTDYATNLKRIVTILDLIDVKDNVPQLRVFPLQYAGADQLAGLISRVVQAQAQASGSIREQQANKVDFDLGTNSLVVLALPPAMSDIEEMVLALDVKPDAGQRNIRFYPLKNTKAKDVAATLEALTAQAPSGVRQVAGARQPVPTGMPGGIGQIGDVAVKIVGDEATNAIIVVAPPEIQEEVANLINELDRRKSQVLIEALVVQVSAGKDLDVGVELSKEWQDGTAGTAFGLSTIDEDTGARVVDVGQGLTGTLLENSEVRVILHALLTDNEGQIVSRPRLLANDNAKATFDSVDEQPYTTLSTVTTTTAVTSFGDYAKAGTTLVITPHISEGDYLTLEIDLKISQFTGASISSSVPPPRRSDNVATEVTIPNDSTIIIGGLSGYHTTRIERKVPLLGDIPVLGWLFKRTIATRDDTTEYIFIKARLAKEDDFSDLLNLSNGAKAASDQLEKNNMPELPGFNKPLIPESQPGAEDTAGSEAEPQH